ncbi:phage tail protein [Jejudonia soesokkakensis]|uniref:Phage tail protein n=1 Tax=Jejudonia soesokkakensis TaxID=1323432 RepID=A0ABW2MXF7_9FLAO
MPSDPFIGEIMPVGFNFAPRSWTTCEGQLLPIAQNTALFSLLGTIYGGDGRTTMGLPDLRGRSIISSGNGPGLSTFRIGQKGGSETHTNTVTEMTSHSHASAVQISTATGDEDTGNGKYIASHANAFNESSSTGSVNGIALNNTGGAQPYNIRNPYVGIVYCICLQGIYPSRS